MIGIAFRLPDVSVEPATRAKLARVVAICGDRLKVAGDILTYGDFFFLADNRIAYGEPIAREDAEMLCFWGDVVSPWDWNPAALERDTKLVAAEYGVKLGQIVKLIRYAISGRHVGPGLYESLVELGCESVRNRVTSRVFMPWNGLVKSIFKMTRDIWIAGQVPKLTCAPRDDDWYRPRRFQNLRKAAPKPQTYLEMSYLEMIVARGFGMITCGDHLGIMVGPASAINGCPCGWAFIPSEILTLELLQHAYEHMTQGKGRRDKFPKNQKLQPGKKQALDDMLETLFDSQDYIG